MPPKRYQTRRASKVPRDEEVELQDTESAADTTPEDDTTAVTEQIQEVVDDMITEESSELATQELDEAVSSSEMVPTQELDETVPYSEKVATQELDEAIPPSEKVVTEDLEQAVPSSEEVAISNANGSTISSEGKQDEGPVDTHGGDTISSDTETQESKAAVNSDHEIKDGGNDVEGTTASSSEVATEKITPERDEPECVMKTDDTAEEILIDLSTEDLEDLDDSKDQPANSNGSSKPQKSTSEPTKVTPSQPSGSQPNATKQVGSKASNENVKITASQKIAIAKQYCKDHGVKWTTISQMQGLMLSLLKKGYFKPGANINEIEAKAKRITAQKEEAAKKAIAVQKKPNVVQNKPKLVQNKPNVVPNKPNANNPQSKPPKKDKPGERANGNSNKAHNETSVPFFNSKLKVKISDRFASQFDISYEQLGNEGMRYLSRELESEGFFTRLAEECGKGQIPWQKMIYSFSKRRIYSNVVQNVFRTVTGRNQVLSGPVRGPKRLAGTSSNDGELIDLLAPITQLLQHQQTQLKRNMKNLVTGSTSTAIHQRPMALPNDRGRTGFPGPLPRPHDGPVRNNRLDVNPQTSASNPLNRNPFLRLDRRVEPSNTQFHQERGFNQVLSSKPKFGELFRQQESHIEPHPPGGSAGYAPLHQLSAQSKLIPGLARNQGKFSKPQFGESSAQLESHNVSYPAPSFSQFQLARGEDQWTQQNPNRTEESYDQPSSFGRRGLSPPSDDDDGYESYLKGERVIAEHSGLRNTNVSQSLEMGRNPWQMSQEQLVRPSPFDSRRLGNVEPKERSQKRGSKTRGEPHGDHDWKFKRDSLPSRNVASKLDNSPRGSNARFENKPSTSTGNLRFNAKRDYYASSEIFETPTLSVIGGMDSSVRAPSPKRFRMTPIVETVPIAEPGKTCRVAVVPLDYPSHHLSSREMDLIRNALLESMSSGNGPRFNGTTEERGAVVFECEDQYTIAWLWETVPTLRPWPGAQLRPTSWRDNRAEFAIEVPKALANLSGKALCEKLISQNPRLNARNWEFKEYDRIRKIAFFAVDPESLEESMNSNFSLYLGFSKVSCTKVKYPSGR